MSGYNDYKHWPQELPSNTDEEELSSPEIEQDDSDDDSETSTSSTSTSASSSSSSSQSGSDSESTSTADEDETVSLKTETAVANNTELSLPAGMCEDSEVFKQLFSVNSWVCLSDQQKQHLKNFLPTFPENDLMEKEITLRMLFGGQSFRFGVNPIDDFHGKLKDGYFRPNIVKMKSMLRRSLKKEYRKNQRIHAFNTLKKLITGRKKIIDVLNGDLTTSTTNIGGSNGYTMHQQVRRRYFRELSDIKHQVGDDSDNSSDSNYQEGPPARLSKKQRRNLAVLQNSLSPEIETVTSTLATFPEGIDLSKIALPMSNPFDPTEDMYREMLISHKRKQKKIEQEKEQMRFDLMKEQIKPAVSLVNEKKRSVVSDRPRVKRTKVSKQQSQSTQPPLQLDVQLPVQLDELDNISVKQEPVESEPISIPFINDEVFHESSPPPPPTPPPPPLPISLPSPSPPPTIPILDLIQEESIKTNLDAIKLEPKSIITDIVKIEEEIVHERQIIVEPISLTADEIRKAEEGQAAAAMLLEQMSDVEEKYNNSPPLILSSPPSSPPTSENNLESKYSPPTYHTKRGFHPEDMLTCTVQSMSTESPPRMLHSCMRPVTPSNYGSKQLSLSPVSTPSKVITDSNYVGSLSELEGFHVLDIKAECNDDLGIKPLSEVRNITVSFFAIIRDIICSTWEYRMNMTSLTERVHVWAKSTLNNRRKPDWYQSLALKTWPKALQSAIGFLAGHFPEWQPEDFVPFIEYKPSLNTYQWIGAGRDSDTRLGELCNCWLHNLNNISSKLKNIKEDIIGIKNVPIPSTADIMSTIEMPETDSSISLPTPLLDTWIVTPSNSEERAVFQAQERQRFLKPHRSFIYRMHGYESVVGPVRGIYNSSNIHKAARGHSLLIENRPHFISILVLVRDATARLPNGMGTRSDICILLKDSQYLMEANQTELHNAVSGALDRLHYENDPCVKYDAKRKIWIYLHRGRTLEEFERLHLEQQGAVKMKCWRRNKIQKKSPEPKRTPNRKLTSNVLSESLSMLDLPTSSTSDSMPSSSTSPVLSDVNMRISQDIMNTESLKLSIKTPRIIKNRKIPMQTTDNAVELNIECPSLIDQNSTEASQMFAMPVSNNISTSVTSNSSTITACNITSKTFTSNINNPFTGNITNPSFTNNIIHQSIASNNIKSIASSNIQSIASGNIKSFTSNSSQSMASSNIQSITSSSIPSIASGNIKSFTSNNSQSMASKNIQSISGTMTNQPISNNITTSHSGGNTIISHSMANTSLKVVNTQSIANTGQMIKIAHTMNSSNQNLMNNNKMVVNSISSNKQVLSSGDLITIGSRKKTTKHVQIAQPVTIGPSSVPSNFQQDHHITITKSPQNKELQRQILVLKQKRSDHSVSNPEQNATIISQTDSVKPQTVQQFLQLQQQQKLQKQQQMQLKLMQHKQIQQQTLQQNKPQVIIRKSDVDDKTEARDGEHPQVKYVIQGPRGVQTEPQPITQQQLQQLLMIRPQQQTGQQVVMVKQPGSDQKPISLKPLLTSIRSAKIHQNSTKTSNVVLHTNQAGQSVQHRITKPIVGKLLSNPRAQLPVDSVIGNRKLSSVPQGTSLRISGVQTLKSCQPQYTVVTVGQQKQMPSNQLSIGQQTPTRLSSINERLKSGDTNPPQTVRVVQSQISGKPLLVTNKSQISSSLTSIPSSSNMVSAAAVNSTANAYTVMQQGPQQIIVSTSSLKSIQGLKVIPLPQQKGRSPMFARIVNDSVRPMFIHPQSGQDTSPGPSKSNT